MWPPAVNLAEASSIASVATAIVGAIVAIMRARRPRLRLRNFEPTEDGIVKAPEFSYGPAAWLRLRVENTSRRTRAENVQVVINRVLPCTPGHSRSANLRYLALKWADRKDTTIDLEEGETSLVDLMKLNAAWSQVEDESAYRAQHPEDLPPRANDVPQDRPEVWALVLSEEHSDRRQELTVGVAYDLELMIKAKHSANTRYTTRLACDGWPCKPPWPCDTPLVWRSFRLAQPLTLQRRGPTAAARRFLAARRARAKDGTE
jgi:hypothetical protein